MLGNGVTARPEDGTWKGGVRAGRHCAGTCCFTGATAPETRPCLLLTEVGSIHPWAGAPASWGYRSKEPHAGGFRPRTCNPSRLWGGKSAVEVWAGRLPLKAPGDSPSPSPAGGGPGHPLACGCAHPISVPTTTWLRGFLPPSESPVLSPLRTAVT